MNAQPVINTNGLSKDYGSGRGVFELDLEVEQGEVFGFLGPNGAGKSTTGSVKAALARFEKIDVLVNNAGIALTERLVDTPPEQFDRVMAANVRGPYLYARECFPALVRSRGCMVHINSDPGLRAEQAIGAYSISKAAVVMMSNVLALDGAPHGVRSNCVCPGATAPGMRHTGPASDPDRGDDDPAT